MIGANAQNVEVWAATTPVDMRKRFDGLAEVVRSFLGRYPLSGSMLCSAASGAERGVVEIRLFRSTPIACRLRQDTWTRPGSSQDRKSVV